ncbi:hypothetical protein AAE250_09045 [Bacteroides sp. GD17]|jgi:hypothetical protein|uniref:hypothetical protein n=1 Tax=Bacteroides sp. GD17 TaxID=3139826 RepID=UPI0025DB3885|nr:hypothetical protein [uncultured Bacteroides sp.]
MDKMRYKAWISGGKMVALMAMAGLIAGCDPGNTELPPSLEESGEPVSLTFDLFREAMTRADDPGASVSTDETMGADKMFRIYAYPAGTTDFSKPTGSENYTVQNDLTATGDLLLYRGNYDMYLLSYNSSTETPVLATADNKVHVINGKDFMYTKLENIVVQPDQTGQNMMKVALPRPFTRMNAQVVTTVAARNGTQPVQPTSLVVNYVRINGLRKELTYKLNNTAWEAAASAADDTYTFSSFTLNTADQDVYSKRVSNPAGILLPVDGTQKLTFDVNLTVGYKNGTEDETMTDTYKASIEKSLLPGMTYQFDFSLTFYGAIIPTDLTLAIKEWTTTDLKGEGLGKD